MDDKIDYDSGEKLKQNELFFKATVTYNQVVAIAIYMVRHHNSINEIQKSLFFNSIKKSNNYSKNEVSKWLKNSWNTEKIMRVSSSILNNADNQYALQWSFPQAYYSIFSSLLSFFKTVGYTEMSHNAVIKKFGELCSQNKYPKYVSFHSMGHFKNIELKNINSENLDSDFHLLFKKESCEAKICQLLKSTREKQISELRHDKEVRKSFKTKPNKKGETKIKQSLTHEDWGVISDRKKETTLLNYLYRKRIKSNYQDIDTFTYEGIKSSSIHKALIAIVNEMNLIHESYIYKALGAKEYNEIVVSFLKTRHSEFLENRWQIISNNFG